MFQRENIVTVPNMLTGLRIAMTPFLGYLVLQQCYPMACIIFVITGITDVVCHFSACVIVESKNAKCGVIYSYRIIPCQINNFSGNFSPS